MERLSHAAPALAAGLLALPSAPRQSRPSRGVGGPRHGHGPPQADEDHGAGSADAANAKGCWARDNTHLGAAGHALACETVRNALR
jgi:hypothetical protein